MPDVTATDASRQFSELLDAVEHDGERYTIVRHGKAIAHIEPVIRGRGVSAKKILREGDIDSEWASELTNTRDLLPVQYRT